MTTTATAPVTAAVDLSKDGGFDEIGHWHDTDGQFAPKGKATAKHLAVEVIRGVLAAAQAKDHPDGVMLKLRPDDSRLFEDFGAGPHLVKYHDNEFGVMRNPRGVRVRWDRFEEPAAEPDLPEPEIERPAPPPLTALPSPTRAQADANRARWTRVLGDMSFQGMSEESNAADEAHQRAAEAVSQAAGAAVADAAYRLPEHAQRAFGAPRDSPDDLFPDGRLPGNVEFYLNYGVGITPIHPATPENTDAYRRYQAMLDRDTPATDRALDVWLSMAKEEAQAAAEHRQHIPESQRVADRDTYAASVGVGIIASAFSAWGESSLNFKTVVAQRAVADAFGMPYVPDKRVGADVQADADALYEAAPEGWQAYARAIYAETQKLLTANGVTEAVLFRGSRQPDGDKRHPRIEDLPPDGPVSSWSVSPNVASAFGGDIRRSIVPAADIFATPLSSGIGVSEEGEVLVLNRPRLTEMLPNPRFGTPDGRMFDIWFDHDQEDVAYPKLGTEFNDLVAAPEAPGLTDALSFVDDTSIPWPDRVDRLTQARDDLTTRLGAPASWFRHPDPATLSRVWTGNATADDQRSLDRITAVEAYGKALATLVAERATELGGDTEHRLYTGDASKVLIDEIEKYSPRSTLGGPLDIATVQNAGQEGAWKGRDPALAAWPQLVAGIRDGTTDVIVKKNEIVLYRRTPDGPPIRASVERDNYGGEWGGTRTVKLPSGRTKYMRDGYGHIEVEVQSEQQSYNNPTAWTRGNGQFDALHTAVKAALDKSKKDSYDDIVNPAGLRAWIDTMERMGVDMGTDPGILTSSGTAPEVTKTVTVWGEDIEITGRDPQEVMSLPKTPLGELKASTAAAKTYKVGLAPYPLHWTSLLPPQHLDIATSKSQQAGNAYNSQLDGGNYVRVASVVGAPQHAGAVAHEFGHSMEQSVPGLYLAEMWHLIHRLAAHPGEQQTGISLGRGRGWRDHFTDDYSGKVYLEPLDKGEPPRSTIDGEMLPAARSFEMFTTGVQGLYGKGRRNLTSDPELTAFTLGVMSLIHEPSVALPPEFNDLPDAAVLDRPAVSTPPVRAGSAAAHEWLDRVEEQFGDPVAAEPGYELQTPWYSQRDDKGFLTGRSVDGAYDIDRYMEMAGRLGSPDAEESDQSFASKVRAGMIEVFEDMERAGIPSPRSPETRAALRRVADQLPDGVELQVGSKFYGDGPSKIGVPVEGIEGIADALERFAHILPEVHLDKVKLTEDGHGNGKAYVYPRHDLSSLVLATGMWRWPHSQPTADDPAWNQENYQATTWRELTDHLMTHEIGHLIQMELVRRGERDLTPNPDRPKKVLDAMVDDAMDRLNTLATEHPDLFEAATGQAPGQWSSHALTASGMTKYAGADAAEYLAEAFAIAVFGSAPDKPIQRPGHIELGARFAMSNAAAVNLWRAMFKDTPMPGAMSSFPADWNDERVAAAILGGVTPPGWGRAEVETLARSESMPPVLRAALEALAAKMGA